MRLSERIYCIDKCHMTANLLVYAELNSNPLGKTLRSNAPELTSLFHHMQQHSRIEFKLGHVLRENNLTMRVTSLLSGERKKKEDTYKQIADI